MESERFPYILGLDIGANSVGWAVVRADETNGLFEPCEIVNLGVRIMKAI